MKLFTERLVLVPLGTKHYNITKKYSTDPENTKMMCFLPCDDEKEVMDYLEKCEAQWKREKPEYLDAAIILDDCHIGAVSIEFSEDHSTGELGWIIDKEHWGRGYAAEAAICFMDHIAGCFDTTRFIAHADAENYASIRVMEKIGMQIKSKYSGRRNRNSTEDSDEVLYEIVWNK